MKHLILLLKLILYTTFLPIYTYSQTPTFEWAKQIDIDWTAFGQKMVVNQIGDTYITGSFSGTVDFDPGSAVYNMTSNSNDDIFIVKLNTSGNLVWAKQIGSSGSSCKVYTIAVDSLGYIYITGYFGGTVDFDPSANTYYLSTMGSANFILKLDGNGSFIWTKEFGDNGTINPYSINVDNLNYIHIAGSFFGTADFDPSSNTFNLSSKGSEDIFVSKIDASSGNLIWAKSVGGKWMDDANALAIDEDDNIYVVGEFEDTVDFDPGAGISKLYAGNYYNLFVLKLDSTGSYNWAKKLNASRSYYGKTIAVDKNGNSYITGFFDGSTDFDPSPDTFNLISTTRNAFVLKLTTSGNFAWANHIEGIRPSYGNSIVLDGTGSIYITGDFVDSTDFDPGPGTSILVSNTLRAADVYIAKYDTSGSFKWVSHISGDQDEGSYAIGVDNSNNVYTSGHFRSTCDFKSGPGTFNMTATGITSFFIHKLSQCDPLDTSVTVNGNTLVSNSVGSSYQWIDCNNPLNILVNDTNQSFTATSNGTYAVVITENSCSDTSACYNIVNVGTLELDLGTSVALYPNPTNGQFNISFSQAVKRADIKIYDISGKKISEILGFQGNTASLDLMGKPNGIYVVEITTAQGTSQVKLVKL